MIVAIKSRVYTTILVVVTALSAPTYGSPAGDAAEDIIEGCHQFIKFARKGHSREDPDTMRHLG
jgi:hypothetical protein